MRLFGQAWKETFGGFFSPQAPEPGAEVERQSSGLFAEGESETEAQ